ncbi:ELMO domain-containing protein 3 isoform X3 [Onychostruthus taczanowskii]|uniref:ELMO domain-containing protein 3 isoform X3 n=1 Tax=Onychostruthus taczanowskii TaxID=356909 RepID=UPI001B80A794|nr:ELMO domain-containing protein 3 isoform X3 [Onychostruthus taczanowskii]
MSGAGGSERPEQRLEQRPEERPEHRQRVVPPIPALGQGGVLQELMLGVGQPPDPGISEEQRQAREEWEALEEIQSGAAPPPISFSEALQHFQSAELSSSRGKVRAPGRRGILAALLRCLCGPPRLRPQLRGEQELALAMAQCADPGTDLRGTGMLGLMQILFFVLDSRTLPLAREIFQLSQHETQNFPFCIMSVNITRIVIQALQEERLSRECNRRQQVIAVLNDLYAAAFLRLSRLWEQQHGTVANAAFFLKELELSTKKKPRQLLKSLEAYLSRSLRPPSPPSSSQIQFTSICDPGVELEGDS